MRPTGTPALQGREDVRVTKEREIRAPLATYRRGAVLLGRKQWRLFFAMGRFNKSHDADRVTFAAVIGSAARVQMCRRQVVPQLDSWPSNRANEFRDTVNGSNLDPDRPVALQHRPRQS